LEQLPDNFSTFRVLLTLVFREKMVAFSKPYVCPELVQKSFKIRNNTEEKLLEDVKAAMDQGLSHFFLMSAPTGTGKMTYLPFLFA